MRRLLCSTALVSSVLAFAPRASAALSVYHLYIVWLQGEGEADQKNLDSFVDCLLHRTSYETYWSDEALVIPQGSYVVAKPSGPLGDANNLGPFIEGLITSGALPKAPSYGTPVYEVMVDPSQTSCALGNGTGGNNAAGTVSGKPAGLVIATTNPAAYWPVRDPIGCETQLTEHEVAEVIDALRGGANCSGDFCCQGFCNNQPSCNNLEGLACPGAPATTKTGATSCGDVAGWLVQTLTHDGTSSCSGTATCDFKLGLSCLGDEINLHGPCSNDADCCPGLTCASWAYSANADDPARNVCCKGGGSKCTLGSDCCSGMNCDTAAGVCVTPDAGAADSGSPDADDGGHVTPTYEPGGCACSSTPFPAGGTLPALGILGLGALVIRRRQR